jgi:hypothetical protein
MTTRKRYPLSPMQSEQNQSHLFKEEEGNAPVGLTVRDEFMNGTTKVMPWKNTTNWGFTLVNTTTLPASKQNQRNRVGKPHEIKE